MLQLCHPCSVDYDVYISFKHLPDDAFGVLDMFDIPHEYYRNIENHPEYTTSDLVELYFGNMSDVERMEKMAALNDQGEISINDSPPSRYALGGGGEYCCIMCVLCYLSIAVTVYCSHLSKAASLPWSKHLMYSGTCL